MNPGEVPRQNVRITIQNGVVEDISEVPPDERSQIEPIALAPQLVNAHTHLEFSSLNNPLTPQAPFPDWIRSVIRYRMSHDDVQQTDRAIQLGLAESRAAGVCLTGEITTSDPGLQTLSNADDAVVSFREFIGFREDSIRENLIRLDRITDSIDCSEDAVRMGLSPHAPYSVHPELIQTLIETAIKEGLPVAMHVAESRDELELLRHGTGRFREFLTSLDLWSDATLSEISSVTPYLEQLARCNHGLAIHCNYLTDQQLRFLGSNPQLAVVYCPRTHNWFRHDIHPFQKVLDAGGSVILGTDSRASSPDLSIWRELQFVCSAFRSLPIWDRLPMITTDAATALGKDASEFRIDPGQEFRAIKLRCHCATQVSLNESLLDPDCQPVPIPAFADRDR